MVRLCCSKTRVSLLVRTLKSFRCSVLGSDPLLTLAALFSITAGTLLLVWMGELITEFGIGQGVSMIILGGIVSGIPGKFAKLVTVRWARISSRL